MAVVLETSIGEITVDLFTDERPKCSLNFLKLCKVKYFNFGLFHSVQSNLVAQAGDPTETGKGGSSIFGILYGDQARYFDAEVKPRMKHKNRGTLSMVNNGDDKHGSQFFLTLADEIDYLDGKHTVFGEVAEGSDVLDKLNDAFVDRDSRPYQDIRIYHTVVLDDPFDDPRGLAEHMPDKSPIPTKEQLQSSRIGAEEDIDDFKGKSHDEIEEIISSKEAKANAQILEIVGDLPEADIKPPDNVLFVCKLNPVTTADDLEIIFSRFGTITSCEVITDQKTGESLQYAFIEFEKDEECENAYFKMDNVLIDDRRIHVDFSQSVSKLKYADWRKRQRDEQKEKQQYVIKDRSKKDNYELVFSDKEDDDAVERKHKKKKKKEKKKHKKQDSDSDDSPKKKKSRKESPDSRYSHKEKDRNREDPRKDYNRDSERSHKHDRYYDKPDKSRDRHRERSRERYRR